MATFTSVPQGPGAGCAQVLEGRWVQFANVKLRSSQLLKPSMNIYMDNKLFAQNPFLTTFALRKNDMRDCRVGKGFNTIWSRSQFEK